MSGRRRCWTPEKLRYRDEIEARAAVARLNRRYPDDPVEPYQCEQKGHGWHVRRTEKARQRVERLRKESENKIDFDA